MVISLHSARIRVPVVILSGAIFALMALHLAREAYVSWCVQQETEDSLKRAIQLDPNQCDAYYWLGIEHTVVPERIDLVLGEQYFRQAVRCEPLSPQPWLGLALALESAGRLSEAQEAAEKAVALMPYNTDVIWRLANICLRAGNTDEALDLFRKSLEKGPQFSGAAFRICWSAVSDKGLILERALPDTTEMNLAYLDFLSSPDNLDMDELRQTWSQLSGLGAYSTNRSLARLDALLDDPSLFVNTRRAVTAQAFRPWRDADEQEAKAAWKRALEAWNQAVAKAWNPRLDQAAGAWNRLMSSSDDFPLDRALPYISALIRVERVDEATTAWNQLVARGTLPLDEQRQSDELIVNGGFEAQPVSAGFDWIVEPVQGVTARADRQIFHGGLTSLALSFQGLSNINYTNLRQIVPVAPDTVYGFSVFMKSRALSSSSGPHFELYDLNDAETYHWTTADVLGTTEWQEYLVTLRTGPETHFLMVRLRRTPAADLQNRIEGTLWIDDATLYPQAPVSQP